MPLAEAANAIDFTSISVFLKDSKFYTSCNLEPFLTAIPILELII